MLVYGTQSTSDPTVANLGFLKAAYDYRAFGEQVDLTWPTNKVTETFTGKEKDDETELSYFGARYLDQMLGMWVSVDAKRQFNSPYLYAGNGMNPVNGVDEDGDDFMKTNWKYSDNRRWAIGYTEYYSGTPDKPGQLLGHWPSHSGGQGTPLKPGEYLVGSKKKYDVSSMYDPETRGWKSWAFDLFSKAGELLRGVGGHKVMLHNDDIEPQGAGSTHGCHGILDEDESIGITLKGSLPDLLQQAPEVNVPLIVEEIK